MSIHTEKITSTTQHVKHNLGTQDIIVQAWRNGYSVSPGIQVIDDDGIIVDGLGGGRIVIYGESEVKEKADG